ncbi:MAG: DNA polymerase III subunit delta, partial [Raoultibacter sp.]
ELRRSIIVARDTERAMKSGTDPDVAFLDWVLAVTRRA